MLSAHLSHAYGQRVRKGQPLGAFSLQALSHAAVLQALHSTQGNVTQAARQLGISRQTIYRKLGTQALAAQPVP